MMKINDSFGLVLRERIKKLSVGLLKKSCYLKIWYRVLFMETHFKRSQYIFFWSNGRTQPSCKQRSAQPQGEEPGTKSLRQDGEEVFFKIKNSTQLKKLMDAYCQRQSVIIFPYSWTPTTCASFLMERDFTRTRPPRSCTWRTETRSMSWLSKLAVPPYDPSPQYHHAYSLLFIINHLSFSFSDSLIGFSPLPPKLALLPD